MSSPDTPRLRLARVVAALLAGIAVACGGGTAHDTIERDAFIATYVDLRIAALETDSGRVAAADREEILGDHQVTEDDLMEFAEVHGADMEFMRDVWNEVEARLDRESDSPDDSSNLR
jgi:hypothetical protein